MNSISNDTWPGLDALVASNGRDIIGDVQHLLDFVIAGHAKTGTSSLMTWLSNHPQVYIRPHEVQSNLKVGRPEHLVRELHRLFPGGYGRKRGYKAPNEIHFRTSIRLYAKYWPKTKIVVGVRHPVSWFNSWHNFRVNNDVETPPPEDFVDKESLPTFLRFHENLSLLGKTGLSHEEKLLLGDSRRVMTLEEENVILEKLGLNPFDTTAVPNQVFLYDIKQADSTNSEISETFRRDLSNFLDISMIPDQPKKNTMTRKNFDICDEKYLPLREKLVAQGQIMSQWILSYFIKHPDVIISSPSYFEQLVMSWGRDPCNKTQVSSGFRSRLQATVGE